MSNRTAYQREYRRKARLRGRTCQGCGLRPAEVDWRVSSEWVGIKICGVCKAALEQVIAESEAGYVRGNGEGV